LATVSGPTFDGDGAAFRLAAEALRIRMAGQHDTMLAVNTSDLDPLPHQIKAVYGELLPRVPLRFLLADDPGAGKTIMAGLYVKELALRGDLARCLIVAPGGLVEQWQDELHEKLGLRFELLTTDLIAAVPVGEQVFGARPLLIARMDQLRAVGLAQAAAPVAARAATTAVTVTVVWQPPQLIVVRRFAKAIDGARYQLTGIMGPHDYAVTGERPPGSLIVERWSSASPPPAVQTILTAVGLSADGVLLPT
jgi:hypothetical protein